MRKLFLIAAIVLSATAAHASGNLTLAGADSQPAASSSAQPTSSSTQPPATASSAQVPDANAIAAAKRQAMIEQKMAMQRQIAIQKQMAMQRQMQLHPIRTRLQFAFLRFKRKMRMF